MENFRFIKQRSDENKKFDTLIITKVTRRDHEDIHYLYRLRKALTILVGDDNMTGLTVLQIESLHEQIVRSLIDNNMSHWYSSWDTNLDDKLPEDLKLASEGYDPPPDSSLFDLEVGEKIYRELLEEHEAICLWSAPTARAKIPSGHFLDTKNKKYPYKNADGTINCGGLQAAYKAARGARGAPKRASIAAKAKRLISTHCSTKDKKKAEFKMIGKLI